TSAATNLPLVMNFLSMYDTLLIQYPFANEKYGHCQFNWGGGMEHQTMTFMDSYDFLLIGHELAHQWFGDRVTCGNWEDIWLNEGFATYFEALCENEFLGASAWTSWKQNTRNNITSAADGSVKCSDTTDFNRIFDDRLSYNKGAFLLHM